MREGMEFHRIKLGASVLAASSRIGIRPLLSIAKDRRIPWNRPLAVVTISEWLTDSLVRDTSAHSILKNSILSGVVEVAVTAKSKVLGYHCRNKTMSAEE